MKSRGKEMLAKGIEEERKQILPPCSFPFLFPCPFPFPFFPFLSFPFPFLSFPLPVRFLSNSGPCNQNPRGFPISCNSGPRQPEPYKFFFFGGAIPDIFRTRQPEYKEQRSKNVKFEVAAFDRCRNVLVMSQIQRLTRPPNRCLKQFGNPRP